MTKLLRRHSGSPIDSLSPFQSSQSRFWEKIPVVMSFLYKSDLSDNRKHEETRGR